MFGAIASIAASTIAAEKERIMWQSIPRIDLKAYSDVTTKLKTFPELEVITKCNCCGSLDFVKHHSNTICSYCRTPNHVR